MPAVGQVTNNMQSAISEIEGREKAAGIALVYWYLRLERLKRASATDHQQIPELNILILRVSVLRPADETALGRSTMSPMAACQPQRGQKSTFYWGGQWALGGALRH